MLLRQFIYQRMTGSDDLKTWLGVGEEESISDRIMPRASQTTITGPRPFIIYGLGNITNEFQSEDGVRAYRQFLQIWLHDEGGDYSRIDNGLEVVKTLFVNAQSADCDLTTINWLETSQEFTSEQYNTIFRYHRFQAIIANGSNP